MKKYICFILILSLISPIFCGCKSNDKTNSADDIKYIKSNMDFYGDYLLFGNGQPGNNQTLALDLNTLEKTTFCNQPNCTHSSSSCLAGLIGNVPVIYNDNVFYFDSSSDIVEDKEGRKCVISSKLLRSSLSTFETKTVCEFSDCMPNIPQYYVLNNNILYFTCNNMNPVRDEFGNISTSNAGGIHYLCSIDLDTGKYTNYGSIYDGDKEYPMSSNSSGANITGIYQDKIYIQYVFMKESPDVLGILPELCWTRINFEYDISKGELKESTLPASVYSDQDTYAYIDHEKEETVVIKNGQTYHLPYYNIYQMSLNICNNKAFGVEKWFDLSDMKEHTFGKYTGYNIITYYDNHYILMKGGNAVKLTEEELLALDKE